MQTIRIELTVKTILQTAFILALLWLLFLVRDILVVVFLSYIVMSAFNPVVDSLARRGVPRFVSALLVALTLLGVVSLTVASLVPPLLEQTKQFLLNLPLFVEQMVQTWPFLRGLFQIDQPGLFRAAQELASQFSREIVATPLGIVRLGASFLGHLFSFVTFIFVSFYLLLEHRKAKKALVGLAPARERGWYAALIQRVEEGLGAWLRGELILMLIIGAATYLALRLIGLPFALPLAVLAGLLEIVPIIGPIISVVPALFVAASISAVHVAVVAVLYTLIQQLESNLIVPQVMRQAVGLDPLVVLIAILAGTRLMGPLGALLSVPVVVVVATLADELRGAGRAKPKDTA